MDFSSVETKKSDLYSAAREGPMAEVGRSIHYHRAVLCKRSIETEYEAVVVFITTKK